MSRKKDKLKITSSRYLMISVMLLFAVVTVSCQLVDNRLRGYMGKDDPFSLSKLSAPLSVVVDIDETNRVISLSNIQRGPSFKVTFNEDSGLMSDLNCSYPPSYISILSNGLKIQAPLSSTSETINLFCDSSKGSLEFRLSFGSEDLAIISTTPGSNNTSPQIGGPDNAWVLYESSGHTLDGFQQILATNIETKETLLVSGLDATTAGLGASYEPQFSSDGTKVVFRSNASNLAASNGIYQIYTKDFTDLSQAPVLISGVDASTAGLSGSYEPQFSTDGTQVVFKSFASNFASYNGQAQIYIKDITDLSLAPVLISGVDATTAGLGWSSSPQFSVDGIKVVFTSISSNFPSYNGAGQIYTKDLTDLSQAPVLISGVDASTASVGGSYDPQLSTDGTKVVFYSKASNFPSYNGTNQIYIKDLTDLSQAPLLISGVDITTAGLGYSYAPQFSADGTKVVFYSNSSNFASSNGSNQIYIKDLTDLSQAPVLISAVDATTAGLSHSYKPQFSADGSKVVFYSPSYNFTSSNGQDQIYIKDLTDLSLAPTLISGVDATTAGLSNSIKPQISADGSKVVFGSDASNFASSNGSYQIYLKDLTDLSQAPVLISGMDTTTAGLSGSYEPQFSTDGSKLVFKSNASNFAFSNGSNQIYIKDLTDLSQAPVLISGVDATTAGVGLSQDPQFSTDGSQVIFRSNASNFASSNGWSQIYIKDLTDLSQAPVLISGVDVTTAGLTHSFNPQFSADGTKVVFESVSSNFASSNGQYQIYTKDLTDLSLAPVLISGVDATTAGLSGSYEPQFSTDGSKVVFKSNASNFASSNGSNQIYIKDLTDLSLAPVLISAVDATTAGLNHSYKPQFSADGTKVVYYSNASNFAFSNGSNQIYIKDITDLSLAPVLISAVDATTAGLSNSLEPQFSADGSKVVFQSISSNFPSGNELSQIYIKKLP